MKQWAILILFLYAATPLTAEKTRHLTLLTEDNHPYSYIDKKTGRITGSAVTIIQDLMLHANITYDLSLLPWQRAYRGAQTQKNTCAFATNRTVEREPLFQWVGPIYEGGWAVFKRPGSNIKITAPADMKPYVVTGKMGSPSVDSIAAAANIDVVRAGNDETAARLLFHGRADLWVSGVLDAPVAAEQAGLPMPELALLWRRAILSLACSKTTNPELIDILNKINADRLEKLKEVTAQNTVPNKR